MKLWVPKWLREERKPSDAELESTDRRLFLRGLTLTSAGMVVGVPLISVPKPVGSVLGIDWTVPGSEVITYFVIGHGIPRYISFGAQFKAQNGIVVETMQELFDHLPKHGGGCSVQVIVKPGVRT